MSHRFGLDVAKPRLSAIRIAKEAKKFEDELGTCTRCQEMRCQRDDGDTQCFELEFVNDEGNEPEGYSLIWDGEQLQAFDITEELRMNRSASKLMLV